MKKAIDQVIAKLEQIQVSGVGAILMGESLKELIAIKANAPEEAEGESNADD